MKLTAPLYVLKGKARALKHTHQLTMIEALDHVARAEGFSSWSLLQSKMKSDTLESPADVLTYLNPGDLVLIGARPLMGKTAFTLKLLLHAVETGQLGFFFSLEYTYQIVVEQLSQMAPTFRHDDRTLILDFSEEISAEYIIKSTMGTARAGTLIVVDYLQILDQRRDKPPLQKQIEDLRAYARQTQCVFVFISQIDRSFKQDQCNQPTLKDIRLPNPLDLALFNKAFFVRGEEIFR